MKVKLLRVDDQVEVEAMILKSQLFKGNLPSITDEWRFNFKKNTKKYGCQTFVLVTEDFYTRAEGCLIFEMKAKVEPYMAYIEIAPHNKGNKRIYQRVAECLIAFACRLSFIYGEAHYKGWLAFDVLEINKENQIKLMALYSKKYNALKFGENTMIISPEDGENLINTYLN